MANIKLVINPIAITNYLVVVVEAVNNLGVEVTRQSFAPPHTQRNTTFPDLNPIMYRFFFWESADGVALDTLLGSADIDGSIAFDAIFEIWELVVDGPNAWDPVAGQDAIEIPELETVFYVAHGSALAVDNVSGYMQVFQRGVGPKILGEIENFSPFLGRGFRLLNGDLFVAGDIWVINVIKKVITTPAAPSNQFPEDIVEISAAETTLGATHYNKAMELTYAGGVQKINLDLDAYPDKKYFVFNTHFFPGLYVEITCTTGQIRHEGNAVTKYWIPAGRSVNMIIKDGIARITFDDHAANRRGAPVFDYAERIGHVIADRTEYTKAQAPGLYNFVESLAPGVACSFADQVLGTLDDMGRTVYLNLGRWAIDTGAEKIRVPDLRNAFIRGLAMAADGERTVNVPGGGQQERVGKFQATPVSQKGWSYTGAPNNDLIGNGDPNHQESKTLKKITFTPLKADNITATPETRPFNYGLIPLIIL